MAHMPRDPKAKTDRSVVSSLPTMFERAVLAHRAGQVSQAQSLYEQILNVQPRHADALHLLGVLSGQQNNFERALELLSQATLLNPDNAVAHCDRGRALKALGRLEASLASYDRAIGLKPQFALAHCNRGNVLRDLKQHAASLASYDAAIAIKPDYAEAYFNRGVLLGDLGQWDASLASYDRAIAIKRDYAEALCNRGVVLERLARWDEALASYDRAISVRGNFAAAHSNRGNVLWELQRLEAALDSCDAAIALKADLVDAHCNRGVVLACLNRLDAALDSYERTIALDPRHANARYGRSTTLLLIGHFEAGWADYEWRWKYQQERYAFERRTFLQPLWLGQEALQGKTILLYCEQGLGDTIQFCRYAKLVSCLGATVVLQVQKPLVSALAGLEGVSQLIASDGELPAFDFHCPLMSLPLAFKTELHTIPADTKYLCSDDDKAARWRSRLGERTRKRIGLAWSGNSMNANDKNRSIPLADLVGHLPAEFDYVSLQKDMRDADRGTLRSTPAILDVAGDQRDFSDTAALCACLDLVISVDTSVAHLSGALGKPTWILLPFLPDWRWLLDRTDSPWYPTVTLYRQTSPRNWDGVLRRLAMDLKQLLA
jgi:tetratricopeptide (TPR) repeat protein